MTFPETLRCDSCGDETSTGAYACDCGENFDPLCRISQWALDELGHSEAFVIPKEVTDDPIESGYRFSRLGKPKGQKRDYRMKSSELHTEKKEGYTDGGQRPDTGKQTRTPDRRELHLREYEDRYTLHWDAHPARSPMHAVKDAPDYGAICVAVATVAVATVASGLRRYRRKDTDSGAKG